MKPQHNRARITRRRKNDKEFYNAREHISNLMIRRLLDNKRDVTPVGTVAFGEIIERLQPVISHYARQATKRPYQSRTEALKTHLPLTQDDLEGFFILKVHQELARGNFDLTKNPSSYFRRVFLNLTRDIIRAHSRAVKNGLDTDALDLAFLDLWGDK